MLRKALILSGIPRKSGWSCSEKEARRALFDHTCPRLGGDAPKQRPAADPARAIFTRFLPFLGGNAPK